jgi:hypothetical protein
VLVLVAGFNIDIGSMSISRVAPEDFLLSLRDVGAVNRVMNGGRRARGSLYSSNGE